MTDWEWFRSSVVQILEPVLARHGLYRLTGRPFELEENQDKHDGFFYTHESDEKPPLCVDILEWSYPGKRDKTFYWFRIVDNSSFAQLNRRFSNDEALDIFRGWIFYEKQDLQTAFEDAAEVLEEYLRATAAGGTSPSPTKD